MKDVKSLYNAAKYSGSPGDISAYTECVQDLYEHNPASYISSLEYIISSEIGLKTFPGFVEKYGLPIAAYDQVLECVNDCIDRCDDKQLDDSNYIELREWLESYKQKYAGCFTMYEYYTTEGSRDLPPGRWKASAIDGNKQDASDALKKLFDDAEAQLQSSMNLPIGTNPSDDSSTDPKEEFRDTKKKNNVHTLFTRVKEDEYKETYYGFNDKGVQNRKLLKGMVDNFGEAAIADILITASGMGDKALNQALTFLSERYRGIGDPKFYQYMIEATTGLSDVVRGYQESIYQMSSQKIADSAISRNHALLKESMVMGESDNSYLTEKEATAIQDMITMKESLMTYLESAADIMKTQQEIYSLYESLDGYITESGQVDMDESYVGTKHTGSIPDYLSKHHDMGYAGDGTSSRDSDGSDDLEKYRRKSAPPSSDERPTDNTSKPLPDPVPQVDPSDNNDDDDTPTPEERKAINNYYYYTYTNSNNRNTNSFNRNRDSFNRSNNSRTNSNDIHSHNANSSTMSAHGADDDDVEESVDLIKGSQFDLSLDRILGKRVFIEDRGHFDEGLMNKINPSSDLATESIEQGDGMMECTDLTEAVGDADDNKPESDHPIKDALTDIDRATTRMQQKAKKKAQDIENAGRALVKPVKRTVQWINNTIGRWKDADETHIKERMADPHERSAVFKAINTAIKYGSLAKAGLLLNPVILFLTITRKVSKNRKTLRIRNEMIGEIKTEIQILEEKIKDADSNHDLKEKYQMMRFKNELEKKLIRVGGTKRERKVI